MKGKMLFYLLLTLLLTCNAQSMLISNNLVQVGAIQSPIISLTNPGDQVVSQTINFSTAFKSPPLVLISILKTDMQIKTSLNENFNTIVTSTSTTSFNLNVSKLGSIHIDEIAYYYLAIEPSQSQDTFVIYGTIDFQANLVSAGALGIKVAKKFIPYLRSLSSKISEQRKVSAYFIGYEKSVDTSVNSFSTTNIYVSVEQESNGFYIVVESRDSKDDVCTLKTVSYNYIEYYEPTNGYLQMYQIKDKTYLNQMPSASRDGDGNTILPFKTTIDIDSNGLSAIFIGVSGVGYEVGSLIDYGRIEISAIEFTPQSIQSTSTLSFNYLSYSPSEITSVASEILAFVRQDCSALSQKFFDEGKQCLQTCPNRSYEISESTGRTFCQRCHSSCLTCTGASARECLTCEKFRYNQLCFEEQPDATGCDTQPSAASLRECVECVAENCSVCNFTNTSECVVCSKGFVLKNSSICFCESASQYYSDSEKKCVDKNNPFSKETKNKINDVLEITESATFGLSLFFLITSAFTQQGSILMSSAFTNQKIFYVLLFNADLPKYLIEFTRSLTNHGVLKKFSYLNWIWNESYSTEFQVGNKFDSESITSKIMVNSGGGLVFLSFSVVFFIVFYILSSNESCKPRILNIYTRYIGGFLTESLEITILVLQFSVAIALTQTSYFKNKQEQTLVLVFCQLFVLGFMGLSFAYLSRQPTKIEQSDSIIVKSLEGTATQTIVDKLNNGCIKERRLSKIYMFIFLLFEALLFPILFVSARPYFIVQMTVALLLQIIELVYTFMISPFQVRRENKVFLFVGVNLLLIYCMIAVVQIGLMFSFNDPREREFPSYINYFSLSYLILAMIAMLTPAIIQIYLLIIALKNYYLLKKTLEKNKIEMVETGTELIFYSAEQLNQTGEFQFKFEVENSTKEHKLKYFKYRYHKYKSQQLQQLNHV